MILQKIIIPKSNRRWLRGLRPCVHNPIQSILIRFTINLVKVIGFREKCSWYPNRRPVVTRVFEFDFEGKKAEKKHVFTLTNMLLFSADHRKIGNYSIKFTNKNKQK